MIQTTTFEGWLNYNCEWEFDIPVYMVKPVGGFAEAGNDGGIDNLIEEYQISISINKKPSNYFDYCGKDQEKQIKSMCTRAKNNKARKGVFYWKKVIEWNTETFEQKIIEDVIIGKEKE